MGYVSRFNSRQVKRATANEDRNALGLSKRLKLFPFALTIRHLDAHASRVCYIHSLITRPSFSTMGRPSNELFRTMSCSMPIFS
jgi:hypothetical protein